jgi:hypothetical protein
MAVGSAWVALPAGFLDPIGRLTAPSMNIEFRHRDESSVTERRQYDPELSGTLGTDPFTTESGSQYVEVHHVAHGFSQASVQTFASATDVGGVSLNGTWPIHEIIDVDNYTVDLGEGNLATSTAAGGGAAVTYLCDSLIQSSPYAWAIFDERLQFDAAFDTSTACQMLYFKSPPLLSVANPSNFLCVRYPKLMRVACVAAAADFMKDTEEYSKNLAALQALIGGIAIENDLMWRGAEIETGTP